MQLVRGQKVKLSDITSSMAVEVGISLTYTGAGSVDITCFGVDAANRLSDDRYFIFYNQPTSPANEIRKLGAGGGDSERFALDLARLPSSIVKLVFTAAIDGAGTMSQLTQGHLRLSSQGSEVMRFPFTGSDFAQEKAIIIAEIYLKDIWRIAAVGQGFNGGLSALLSHFGGSEVSGPPAPPPAPPTPPTPPVPPPPTVNLKKITLEKSGQSQKIDLRKQGQNEPFHINLNWDTQVKSSGFFGGTTTADLDLGCLYEMADGRKGVIQALGDMFGSRDQHPHIFLDKDDRSGTATDGENLYVLRPDLINRVVVYAFIYEGTARFQDVNGRVTIKDDAGNEIHIPLNNPDSSNMFCAICALQRVGNSLSITKEERYFAGHAEADKHYGFGFRWISGRK